MDKQGLYEYIENNKDLFISVSRRIWELAELSLEEKQSADLYCRVLEEQGFRVTRGLSGIETAFCGTYGSGRPVIGFLGEFDALSGLSQEAGATVRKPLIPGGSGHGCGHNMLGAGSLAAACAVRQYLIENGLPGTVIFYGCPGEEGYASKAYMARDGIWEGLDAAITWHPDTMNRIATGSCIASVQREYTFHGVAAHAAGNPELGRSALDAVQLMNIAAEFLREHVPDTTRMHYAITDAGGVSPNVVPSGASVMYMVRCPLVADTVRLASRIDKIAHGAAEMTETTVDIRHVDGTANTVNNRLLERLAYDNLVEAGIPEHTEEERSFAAALKASIELPPAVPEVMTLEEELSEEEFAFVRRESRDGAAPLNDFPVPYRFSRRVRMGSTDVGDVSWQTPTVQFNTVTFAADSPGHSWQNVSCGATSVGDKGMLAAAKAMAGLAADLIRDPEKLGAIQAEFREAVKDGYVCPV